MSNNINRLLDLQPILNRKSCFLLGPRQTGKTALVRQKFPAAKVYNLLETDTYRTLSRRPQQLREELHNHKGLVVIDEIQLLPELLNEVHLLIEERSLKFLLTGSSARKLRRSGVNLLGGRASWKELHPFTAGELGDSFDLQRALTFGLLPSIYFSTNQKEDLKDYIELYLREEIANETAIRQLPAYSRFLDVAALCNTQIVNYTEVANDAQLPPTTVREYFHILTDTLLIHRLPAWRESKKRKAFAKDKFYFFDIGVARYLQGHSNNIVSGTEDYGSALETYIFHELKSHCAYISSEQLSFWRSTSGYEVDFLIGEHTAIEVKASQNISDKHLRGLKALREEGVFKKFILVCLDKRERIVDGILIMPVEKFIKQTKF